MCFRCRFRGGDETMARCAGNKKKHQEPVATSFGGRFNVSKRVMKPGYLPWDAVFEREVEGES